MEATSKVGIRWASDLEAIATYLAVLHFNDGAGAVLRTCQHLCGEGSRGAYSSSK